MNLLLEQGEAGQEVVRRALVNGLVRPDLDMSSIYGGTKFELIFVSIMYNAVGVLRTLVLEKGVDLDQREHRRNATPLPSTEGVIRPPSSSSTRHRTST